MTRDLETKLKKTLIGRKITHTDPDTGRLTLDNGTIVEIDTRADDCCSYLQLAELHTTEHAITNVWTTDDEHITGGDSPYTAWIYVLTDGGEKAIAEAHGDATSGFYLHGFALNAHVITKENQ